MAWEWPFATPCFRPPEWADSGAFGLGAQLAAQLGTRFWRELTLATGSYHVVRLGQVAALQCLAQFSPALQRPLVHNWRAMAGARCCQQRHRPQQHKNFGRVHRTFNGESTRSADILEACLATEKLICNIVSICAAARGWGSLSRAKSALLQIQERKQAHATQRNPPQQNLGG
jgi:hypothetical protein